MLNETNLEIPYVSKFWLKTSLKFQPFFREEDLKLISTFGSHHPKIEKNGHKLLLCSSWSVKHVVGFLLP